ncbi:hypothetical protein D9615_004648 [Tricholomella constricta]|uniref:General stress protein FMN-binding split barrel domain-containing protein n=1 Tax=Tricholomella constricta TaxID=117010 RepID=A0A8H5HBX7_9AGAR|nr:hypothetical protein D9615_004648 [Tricholomella constricta]
MSTPALDPYTANAENSQLTPLEKISGAVYLSSPSSINSPLPGLHQVVNAAKVGMLTTRSAQGSLHARAMTPCKPFTDTQVTLVFLANNVSHKFEEIENDAHVNVSFLNTESTAWASFSGKAKVSRDKELIKKHWSSYVSAYFGDLKDGTHKGDETDPRISVIEVIPDEIRYWMPTKGAIGRAIEAGLGAMTGKASAPGEIRTITKAEV